MLNATNSCKKMRYVKSKIAAQKQECSIPRIAKMDEINQKYIIKAGYYMLCPVDRRDKIAKMDALLVKIDVITIG